MWFGVTMPIKNITSASKYLFEDHDTVLLDTSYLNKIPEKL